MSATPERKLTTTLILVRHGETEDNSARIPRGQGHGSLTAFGWTQANALGERLRSCRFGYLYSSDLDRAVQTASAISRLTGHEIRQDACLRERHFGMFQGVPWADIPQRFPDAWQGYQAGDPDHVIPDGESAQQLYQRSVGCLDVIAQRHVGDAIVVVTHAGVIHSFLRAVLGIPITMPTRFLAANASLAMFQRHDEVWNLRTFGDVCHLAAVSSG